MKKKYLSLMLLICWLIVIFGLSNQQAEASNNLSNGLLEQIAIFFNISNIPDFVERFAKIIRKCAHLGEYFILGILAYNTARGFKISKPVLSTFAFCFLFAVSDEIHQLFINGRSGSAIDVVIDCFGSLISIFLIHLIEKKCFQEKKH